jgi:hypothetical protein
MFDIVENILKVAKGLMEVVKDLLSMRKDQRDRMATLLEQISECLIKTSSAIRVGTVPHGECGKLITYSEELPKLLMGHFDNAKAKELGDTLRSAYAVERLASDLATEKNKEPSLAKLEEAAGKFLALAGILRAK